MSDLPMPQAALDVLKERLRQVDQEGWEAAHDDEYRDGELAAAAACYAMVRPGVGRGRPEMADRLWPWDRKWWKPRTQRENLVRAGALILAEIERIDRRDARKNVSAEAAS